MTCSRNSSNPDRNSSPQKTFQGPVRCDENLSSSFLDFGSLYKQTPRRHPDFRCSDEDPCTCPYCGTCRDSFFLMNIYYRFSSTSTQCLGKISSVDPVLNRPDSRFRITHTEKGPENRPPRPPSLSGFSTILVQVNSFYSKDPAIHSGTNHSDGGPTFGQESLSGGVRTLGDPKTL